MPLFNVHIYRVMKLTAHNIEAANAQEAAEKAKDMPNRDFDYLTECDGETVGSIIDTVGDSEYLLTENKDWYKLEVQS